MSWVFAVFAGALFAFGLALSGMMDPRKVQAFLDVGGIASGRWDASLAFVMGGALLVTMPGFAWLRARERQARSRVETKATPEFATAFHWPTAHAIDRRLIAGATLFGIGWGLSGYCPGPAIASGFYAGTSVIFFLASMVVGMWIAKQISATESG